MSWLLPDPLTRFIAQLVVILAVARGLGWLAARIRQPLVVAEIVAGIVLGPSVLGWAAPSASAALFPDGSLEVLRMASQLGLVVFVFLIGLELDPALLRGRLRASAAISLASIALPFVLGGLLAWPLRGLAGPHATTLELALFLGAAMSITAFPVLARLLAEHDLLRTRIGTIAIACAAIDDVVAWCLLAFVVAFVRAGAPTDALATTALAGGFGAVMLLVVRPGLARLAARRRQPLAVTGDLLAVVIVGLLVSAWLTERIGIHLVFGGFVFGAVLPRRDGFARAVAEKLSDLAMIVLLPLFFVISGMRTQIDLAASTDQLAACAAIVVVACAGKFGGGAIAARLTGLTWREAGTLGVLMNTRGLMELIAINIGFELGVISPTVFSMMVIMVLVTTVATAPILRRIYPAREAIRDLVAVDPEPPPAAAYRVMACVSRAALGPPLVAIARAIGGDRTEAIALHLAADDAADAADVLEPALARAIELGLAARPLAFDSRDPADDIVRVADLRDIDVVLLAGDAAADRGELGEVTDRVLARADGTVAVYVARGGAAGGVAPRIVVPFHGSRDDHAALELATRIQRSTGAALTIRLGPGAARGAGAEAIARLTGRGAPVIVEHARVPDPRAAVEGAGDGDLVVIGLDRGGGTRAYRDGAAPAVERVLRGCGSSLLVVRGPRAALAPARGAEA